jgi:hypothetical protein
MSVLNTEGYLNVQLPGVACRIINFIQELKHYNEKESSGSNVACIKAHFGNDQWRTPCTTIQEPL